jgi:putative SOS response-associated peptidase YedK
VTVCGRIILITPAVDLARALGIVAPPAWARDHVPRYNVAPAQPIPAVRWDPEKDERQLTRLHWGLVPAWADTSASGYKMINARSETVATKPAFREAYRKRRCIVPVDGFYEWQRAGRRRRPHLFRPAEGGLLGLAGLWELWQRSDEPPVESCAILTTEANALMRPIHDRMPVILPREQYATWLETEPERAVSLGELLKPCPDSWLTVQPVDQRVNRPDFDGPECLAPVADEPDPADDSDRQAELF